MKAKSKLFTILGLSLALLGTVAMADSHNKDSKDEKAAGAKVGEKAPAFTAKDTAGKEHKLSDFAGKIVVLEWYNPDCPFCQNIYKGGAVADTIKQLRALDSNVVYIAINSTANKPEDEVRSQSDAFLKQHKVEIPVLMDYSGTIGKAYDARTTPHMFVIDDKGVLRYQGAFTDDPKGENKAAMNYVVNAVKQIKANETVEPSYVKSWGCSVKYAKGGKNG
jgi:peroxiredoxin